METNEVKTTWTDKSADKSNILSQIKWFFQKSNDGSWSSKRRTKALNFTRRESLISVWVSVIVLVWSIVYWYMVWNHYQEINSNTEVLKDLSTYNVTPNVKNQGGCGSRWSFASTTALAYKYKAKGIDMDLSPQYPLSCYLKDCEKGDRLIDT